MSSDERAAEGFRALILGSRTASLRNAVDLLVRELLALKGLDYETFGEDVTNEAIQAGLLQEMKDRREHLGEESWLVPRRSFGRSRPCSVCGQIHPPGPCENFPGPPLEDEASQASVRLAQEEQDGDDPTGDYIPID